MNDQNARQSTTRQFIPVMLCFFAMGFVDLVGTASNYVKQDLGLDAGSTGFFATMVFFWFLIFSVPTGILMNRIGRKKTVLISLVVTALSLTIPIFGDSYGVMVVSFSFLGIGNAIMQTSLNPLVSNLIAPSKLAATLTLGQFVKAIASFLAPILAAWGASATGLTFGLGWRTLFLIYALVSILSIILLASAPIKEERPDRVTGIKECVALLANPFILLCFIGIICHVGIDVGTNVMAPQILRAHFNDMALDAANYSIQIYFVCRCVGCFLGAFILRYVSSKSFFAVSVLMMFAAMIILATSSSLAMLYIGVGLVGFGNSNVFSIIFSQALNYCPGEKNEVSGLMIMGLIGGAIFPPVMGVAADIFNQSGPVITEMVDGVGQSVKLLSPTAAAAAIGVLTLGVLYLMFYTIRIKNPQSLEK